MKMVSATVLILNVIVCGILALPHNVGDISERVYNTPGDINAAGYDAETHHAITHDGYILEMHRIPYKRHAHEGHPDRPVVFILHGLLAASNSFIFLGPDYSIAFNLADAGFDVWLGNARGTRNSRFHITLDADSRQDRIEFFDFSWEEIGMYDVATMVDYILDKTNKQQLHYIGHSQGGTAFLVLASMRPEYNEKIASAHLLAGVGHQDYFPQAILRTLATYTDTIWGLARRLGIVEMFPPRWFDWINNKSPAETNVAGENGMDKAVRRQEYNPSEFCTGDPSMKSMCDLFGMPVLLEHLFMTDAISMGTGGAALKQIAHYGQNIRDNVFRRWDYGLVQNLETYGTETPPEYDLAQITCNVTMHYTVSDELLDERDVLSMAEIMPNTRARRISRDSFLHADFIFANDVRELVTEYIISAILYVEPPPPPSSSEEETPSPGEEDSNENGGEGGGVGDGGNSSTHIVLNAVVKFYLIIFSCYCLFSS